MQTIDLGHLVLVFFCGLITYSIRLSFVSRKKVVKFSKLNKMILDHIPTACFSALIVSMLIITPNGLNWDFYKITSVLVALIFGLIFKNFMMVIVTGMLCLWLLKSFF